MLRNTKVDNKYVLILADGSMRVATDEGNPDAVRREIETSDGKTMTKYELVYSELEGVISKVKFFDGEYGKSLQLTITDEENDQPDVTLSVITSSNYGEDLMKKLPNIKIDEPVKLVPFSFEDDNGKKKKGVTVYQNGEKIKNFYYDEKSKKNLYGYPNPEIKKGKKWSSEEWKLYFMQARLFLIEDITARFVKDEDDFTIEAVKEDDSDVEALAEDIKM